ncbi:MAG: prepilin peptidase [Candidatus Gracilibacteria bacterium]|nr:prepilin peptidase [Candidatus Gracilibacteria bacterium]
MEIFFYINLFIYGLLFGSFSSVIIHRLYSKERGIWSGRSHCPKCNTTLKYYDLIPIFSWLSTLGKCRYCKEKIPYIYPILELGTGLIFSLVGIFMIDSSLIFSGNITEIIRLFFWLSISFITILYIFYDILFLEIHEGIMLSGVILAIIGLISNDLFIDIIPHVGNIVNNNFIIFISIIFSIISIGFLYLIMLKELDTKYDVLIILSIITGLIAFKYFGINLTSISILSGFTSAFAIFVFFYLQIVLSNGKALGGGDLRIGIMIGLLSGISLSFPAMMLTYIVGSIISIIIIIYQKFIQKNKEILNIVPFGPFLGIGFLITVLFQNHILNIIEIYF